MTLCWRFTRRLTITPVLMPLVVASIILSFIRMPQIQISSSGGSTVNITILLWYWPFHKNYSLKGDVCLQSYGIINCHLVDNRSLYSSADIVVFHHKELQYHRQKLPLHLPRPDQQRWLWMSLEAPENTGNLDKYAGIFNLTMSYRSDADVTVPYGKLVRKRRDLSSFVLKHKTHLACWVVSNYRAKHRIQVYQELKRIIPVQVYGRAVKKPLTESALLPTISNCFFYLAFENTKSAQYITEKLWRNSFQAGTVPVVLGPPRSDYEAVAPPHSFIHVDDFDSIDSLGHFLQEVAKDEKRYMSYFNWHRDNSIKLYTDWRERLCTICQVYDKLPIYNIYHNLSFSA
ncbi:alpha-(1,3)-fucosyltransferase 7 [Trichomycterus rosablanca]|uniref:alpha-(1,3)-fucosyltransferase 7 n=1 Tax=Trichomycterus rosablanca TaxID=2290929 RepID=UPI002F358B89